jgi:hypothetical protein
LYDERLVIIGHHNHHTIIWSLPCHIIRDIITGASLAALSSNGNNSDQKNDNIASSSSTSLSQVLLPPPLARTNEWEKHVMIPSKLKHTWCILDQYHHWIIYGGVHHYNIFFLFFVSHQNMMPATTRCCC